MIAKSTQNVMCCFLEGKLTSLEEFRIEKDAFTLRLQTLEKQLKEKEEEIPQQMDRKERQTVLQIEAYDSLYKFFSFWYIRDGFKSPLNHILI